MILILSYLLYLQRPATHPMDERVEQIVVRFCRQMDYVPKITMYGSDVRVVVEVQS